MPPKIGAAAATREERGAQKTLRMIERADKKRQKKSEENRKTYLKRKAGLGQLDGPDQHTVLQTSGVPSFLHAMA